jgi:hypothetical protein
LWQDKIRVWQGATLPRGTPINLNGYAYTLSATQPSGDRMQVQIDAAGSR